MSRIRWGVPSHDPAGPNTVSRVYQALTPETPAAPAAPPPRVYRGAEQTFEEFARSKLVKGYAPVAQQPAPPPKVYRGADQQDVEQGDPGVIFTLPSWPGVTIGVAVPGQTNQGLDTKPVPQPDPEEQKPRLYKGYAPVQQPAPPPKILRGVDQPVEEPAAPRLYKGFARPLPPPELHRSGDQPVEEQPAPKLVKGYAPQAQPAQPPRVYKGVDQPVEEPGDPRLYVLLPAAPGVPLGVAIPGRTNQGFTLEGVDQAVEELPAPRLVKGYAPAQQPAPPPRVYRGIVQVIDETALLNSRLFVDIHPAVAPGGTNRFRTLMGVGE